MNPDTPVEPAPFWRSFPHVTRAVTHGENETLDFARKLGEQIPGGAVLLLSGDLGAGKTVFTRGLAAGLGVPPTETVCSPTFVLMRQISGGRLTLCHIDAYRLTGGADEFEGCGLSELPGRPDCVVCIEWPEMLTGMAWPPAVSAIIAVEIEHAGETSRELTVYSKGD